MLSRHVEAVHWDKTTAAFADRGYMDYAGSSAPRVDFVQHYGYLSLFPVSPPQTLYLIHYYVCIPALYGSNLGGLGGVAEGAGAVM